ncbi:hypothetical protein ACH4E7_40100 [Kitasatospora sp. NPDC018058]|uniref:hypothetical protein n=1 Tax=Kitasatospora sp. NPDC018058 TaxID=3364025 RepID=UPI0037BFA01A
MLLLGLLLMAASGAFVGLLIADNLAGGPEYQVTILGNHLVTLNTLGVFLSGVALALIFCLGVALVSLARQARLVGARPPVSREARTAPPVSARPAAPKAGEAAPPEERAAQQGDRAVGAPAQPPRSGRIRHLLGH